MNGAVISTGTNYMIKKLNLVHPGEQKISPLDAQNSFFCTYDLGCSAALISVGFELASLDSENPKKVRFVFTRKGGIDEAVSHYWSDKLTVNARTLFDNIKMLKNRIYSS